MDSMEVEEPEPPAPVRRSLAPKSMVEAFRRASRAAFFVGAEPLGGTSFGDGDATQFQEYITEGITRREAWSNLVLALMGFTVCLLPNIMAQCGWLLCPPLLLLSALVIVEMGTLICHACTLVEEGHGRPAGSLKSYEDLANEIGMFKIVLVTKNIVMMVCVLISQKFLTDALEDLIPVDVSASILRWFVIMPMFCVMALLKDLSQLSKLAWLGMVGLAVQLLGLLIGCLLGSVEAKPKKPRSYTMIPSEVYTSSGVTLSAFVFAFAILALVPSVRAQMRQPAEMPLALRDAILFKVVLYEVIMIWGYCAYGETVNENLTVEISESFPLVGTLPSLGLFVNTVISAPLFLFCLCSAIESTGSDACRTPGTPTNTVARIFFVLLLTAVGWPLPEVLPIIGVFSVFCVCNNLWFPILFYHKLRRQAQQPVPTLGLIINLASAILGILVVVFGLEGSLKRLAKEMQWHKDATTTATTTSATTSSNTSVVDLLINEW